MVNVHGGLGLLNRCLKKLELGCERDRGGGGGGGETPSRFLVGCGGGGGGGGGGWAGSSGIREVTKRATAILHSQYLVDCETMTLADLGLCLKRRCPRLCHVPRQFFYGQYFLIVDLGLRLTYWLTEQ
jgi:hypothetical protein